MHENVDINKLYFEYVGPTKDVSFYEYMHSKKLFNEIKKNRIRFNDAHKKQQELRKKINEVKMVRKNFEQEKVVDNLERFYHSREEVFNFLGIILNCYLMLATKQNKLKLKEQDFKYRLLNKCFKNYQ